MYNFKRLSLKDICPCFNKQSLTKKDEKIGDGLFKKMKTMENFFENAKIYSMANSVEYDDGAVVSKIIRKNDAGNITLFAFDKEQVLSEHTAPFDAMIVILDGTAIVTIDKKPFEMNTGDMIIMPANIPHAVNAKEKFKMMLVMLKNQ